ncbi:MAG: VOC family protein [Ferruginibacter sp.]
MTQINAYLTFSGNCREAMSFYKDCIGGELTLQTAGESPMAATMPDEMKEFILHAALVKDNMMLMATDCVGPDGLVKGNAVSLCINCSNENEIKKLYNKLSADGTATHPLQHTFWGAIFGGLTDKYGNHWLLNYNNETKQQL